MFKTLKKRIKNEKGLSLVELLAVIVIMAIIAVIAIPAIGNIINSSRDKGQVSDALNIIAGAKLAHIENGCGENGCKSGAENGNLEKYVDGKDVSNVTVKLEGNDWIIDGVKFEFKSDKFKNSGIKTPAKESDLKSVLDPDAKVTSSPGGGGGN